jgi:hypothetical protein
MVYLAKKKIEGQWQVVHHTDKRAMFEWEGLEPEVEITREEFLRHHNLARVIKGKIFLGYTDEEKAVQKKQGEIAARIEKLEEIDREVDAGRHVRDVTLTAGEALDGFRFIIAWQVKKLGFITVEDFGLPKDFGNSAVTIAEIQALTPPQKNKDETEEKYNERVENFMVWRTLKLFNRLDPTLNEGMQRIRAGEIRAIPIREQLRLLLEE